MFSEISHDLPQIRCTPFSRLSVAKSQDLYQRQELERVLLHYSNLIFSRSTMHEEWALKYRPMNCSQLLGNSLFGCKFEMGRFGAADRTKVRSLPGKQLASSSRDISSERAFPTVPKRWRRSGTYGENHARPAH